MTFSIRKMTVDSEQNVVSLDWSYTNEDGTLGNELKLATPVGDVALSYVTEAVAIGWLEEQLVNTPEEFDAELAKRKALSSYEEGLTVYVNDGTGAFEAEPSVLDLP